MSVEIPSAIASKRRNSTGPPKRLSWPFPLANNNDESLPKAKPAARKRPRTGQVASDVEMWVDKFAPISSIDLCVAPKKVKECRVWLESSLKRDQPAVDMKKLLVLVGSPGVGKSIMIRVLAKEMGAEVHTWNESFVPRTWKGRGFDQMMSVEQSSAIDSFEEFLQQSGAGFSSLNFASDSNAANQGAKDSIILLEELPNLHGEDSALRFRNIMTDHLRGAQVPTILIFSDVSEGKHKPDDLERLIDKEILYSPETDICQIHPVTKQKMKKVLEKIAKRQNCKIPSPFMEELHLQSRGDMRHAIMTLQLQSTGLQALTARATSASQHNDRDVKLSTFHALGKLLYAKRKEDHNGRSVLAFDPEEILMRSDLGVGGSLRFLEYHSPEFFSDCEDLSKAYELFSDAVTILDSPIDSRSGASSFHEYSASAIAGRAVANTNQHPTPNKFRQFSAPKVFDVLRKRRQNEALVDQLSRRLAKSHLAPSSTVGGSYAFVTEILPSMRVIIPDVVNPTVDNFYSIIRESIERDTLSNKSIKVDLALKVQEEILAFDDIADFGSDDEAKRPETK